MSKRKSIIKKSVAMLLACLLVLSSFSTVFAATGSDYANHWAKDVINDWLAKGLIEGFPDGTFRPNESITRAQFAKLVNAIYGFTEEAEVDFTDVSAEAWFAIEIARAVKAGYLQGYPGNVMKPNQAMTRQEVADVITKLENLNKNEELANGFADEIPAWSKGSVGAVAEAEIMQGYEDNHFRPTRSLTRAEALVTLTRVMNSWQTIYSEAGTYGPETGVETIRGHLVVTTEDIILRNIIITGDLTIAESVGEGDVSLDNITVYGTTHILGGGENSIYVKNSNLGNTVVNKENNNIRLVISGNSTATSVTVLSGAKIETKELTGEGLAELIINAPAGKLIRLDGNFELIFITGENNILELSENTVVKQMIVEKAAEIKGKGKIEKAIVKSEGVSFETKPDQVEVEDGVEEPSNSQPTSPGSSAPGSGGGSQPPPSNDTPGDNPALPTIASVDTINVTITVGSSYSLPSQVEANLSDGTTNLVNVNWINSSVNTDAVGEFEFVGSITGYSGEVTLILSIVPDGLELSDDGRTAFVSSNEAFLYAVGEPVVEIIEIMNGFDTTYIGTVAQTIIIPVGVNHQSVDFNDATLSSLHVYGDNLHIHNARIIHLEVGENVSNLTLHNIEDAEGSSHIFNGGGSESIVLTGDTTFIGDVRITSGSDIQVRAESDNAKIEGSLWIESNIKTKISAPVSHVVINSNSSNVEINGKIDNLIVRNNATVTMSVYGSVTTATKRIGVTVTAVSAEGTPLDIEFEEVLDKHELHRYLITANNLTMIADVGDAEGKYSEETLNTLTAAYQQALDIYNNSNEVSIETQGLIDQETERLKNAIKQFQQSVIRVNRFELYDEWKRAQRIANRVTVGNEPGEYPEEEFILFSELISEAENLYKRYGISQQEINEMVETLLAGLDRFLESRVPSEEEGLDPTIEGMISFVVHGIEIPWRSLSVGVVPYRYSNGATNNNTHARITVNRIENALRVDATEIDETLADTYYIIISTNSHLIIETVTSAEIRAGAVKTINVDSSYAPIEVYLPNSTEPQTTGSLYLNIINENGYGILSVGASLTAKVPFGTYNIQYNLSNSDHSYSLYFDDMTISADNQALIIAESDLALIEFEYTGHHALNHRLRTAAAANFEGRKYNSITHPNFNENVHSLFVTKGFYDFISVTYTLEKNAEEWEFTFTERNHEVNENITLAFNDNFRLAVTKRTIYANQDPLNINRNFTLQTYLDFVVINSLDQTISSITKLNPNDWGGHSRTAVNGKVTIVTEDGREFTKDINGFNFKDVKLSEILDGENITGQVDLIFEIDNLPFIIDPVQMRVNLQ